VLHGKCSRVGTLSLHEREDAAVGVLQMDDGCLALALPRSVYRHPDRWSGQRVVAQGELWGQPTFIPVQKYLIGRRWVAMGACDTGQTLYVNRLRLAP